MAVEVLQGTTVAQRGRLPASAPRLALVGWTVNALRENHVLLALCARVVLLLPCPVLLHPLEEVVEVLQGTTVAQRGRLPPSAPRLALVGWTVNALRERRALELLPVAPVAIRSIPPPLV